MGKIKNFNHDNKIGIKIKKFLNLDSIRPKFKNKRIILEGGSIDVNGKGAFNNKECLQSKIQERNIGFKKERL